MSRCSQKTAKGLRCKSHGVEHDGKIICATHLKKMMPKLSPVTPPYPHTDSKEAAYMSLWNSGCEDLCYHLGFCSDVMGDCWQPVYDKSGLKGLKKELRIISKAKEHREECEYCKKWIESLHD